MASTTAVTRDYSKLLCYKCQVVGHYPGACKASAKVLKKVREESLNAINCYRCKSFGHYATDCKATKCSSCYGIGHLSEDCTPQKALCYKCKKNGHFPSHCPYDEALKKIVCFKCGCNGHYAHKCKTLVCSNCTGLDHVTAACPEVRLCYKCHQPGHFASDCQMADDKVIAKKGEDAEGGEGGVIPICTPNQEDTEGMTTSRYSYSTDDDEYRMLISDDSDGEKYGGLKFKTRKIKGSATAKCESKEIKEHKFNPKPSTSKLSLSGQDSMLGRALVEIDKDDKTMNKKRKFSSVVDRFSSEVLSKKKKNTDKK